VRYEGITAADPAMHTLVMGGSLNQVYQPNIIKWAKVIAWRPNTDATAIGGHIILEDCFFRTQDDGHYIGGAVTMRRTVFWHDVNGATFRGDFTTQRFGADNASNVPKEILVEDIDIIYARGVFATSISYGHAIIQGSGGNNKMLKDGVENTGQMVHFRNINIEDPRPVRHLIGMESSATNVGDLAGMRFENVNYMAKQTFGWKGGILGFPVSGYRNLVFDNVSINGEKFGTTNTINPAYIATNQFLYDVTYRINHKIPSTDYTIVATSTNGIIRVNTETAGSVKVTAFPKDGCQFIGWSGDISGTDSIATITMDRDKGITANFKVIYHTVSTTAENGTIILEPTLDKYRSGTVIKVKAVANLGYKFASWSGDLSGTVNQKTITVDGDKSISAIFTSVPTYKLITSAENGRIEIDPPGGIYNKGTQVKVTNTSDFGYIFNGWSGDLSGSKNPATILMDADKSISAIYSKLEGTIVFATNCGGPVFTSADGVNFLADTKFSSGSTYSVGSNITGTPDQVLYRSERYGTNFSYNIPLPDGTYQVMLMFAEIYHNSANQRVLSVSIEGKPVISNLDIWAKVGSKAAYYENHIVTVTDGVLDIAITSSKDNAKISAIKIFQTGVTSANSFVNNNSGKTKFLQIFPNPFSTKTTIQYQLNEGATVMLDVYNLLGEKIYSLVNEFLPAGNYSVNWNATDSKGNQLENGLYFFKLETGSNSVQTLKSVLIK
jgi:hypothetical protein